MRLPFTATQHPFSNFRVTFSTLFGASAGHTPIVGFTMRMEVSIDSRSSASCESPARFASVEYFFFVPTKATMPRFARNSTICVRPGNLFRSSASRHGAYTPNFGSSTLVYRSKRIWSLPRPVAPWTSATQPAFFIAGRSFWTVTARAMPVEFQ